MSRSIPKIVEPHFQPFEGRDYRNQSRFPGRLLILGESHYLREQEKDNTSDFTQRILSDVARDRTMRGWKTRYFRNLFYVLTDRRWQDVSQEEWESVWNSIAFYNYIQSARLTRPRMRPNREEWEKANSPFRTVLSRLKPEFILITGSGLYWRATAIEDKKEGVSGLCIPTGENHYAFVTYIYHPSSIKFVGARKQCRSAVQEMFDRK